MSERKRPDGRGIWPWWRRIPFRFGMWAYGFFVGPFLTADGKKASHSAILIAALGVVECLRLLPQDGPGEMRLVTVIGWPDAFVVFVLVFGRALDKAMNTVADRNPEKLVEMVLSRMGVGDVAQAAQPFVPNQWRDGDPDAGII